MVRIGAPLIGGLVILAAAGVTASADPSEPAAQASAAARVSMGDNFFKPAKLRVKPGTTVTWTNNGNNPHNATADNGSFRTGNLNAGQSRSATLRRLGKYPYVCTIHPGMSGVLKVCKKKNGRLVCRK